MAIPITGQPNFPTSVQVPNNSIMDLYNRQAYLGNQFFFNSQNYSLADANEHPVLYLSNTSTKVSLFHTYRFFYTFGSSSYTYFRVYANPIGVSGGTAKTPNNSRIASSNTSQATLLYTPTVATSNGTLLYYIPSNELEQNPRTEILIVDPGNSLLFTVQGDGTSTSSLMDILWHEI